MGYTDLGNNQGRLYAVRGGNIHLTKRNTAEGLRLMKSWALKSRALGLGQRGVFTIEIGTITDAGNVTAVPVNAVDQINGSIAYDVGDEVALATAIAAAINNTTPATGVNYMAVSLGNKVVGYAPVGSPTSINGDTVAASNTGDITITTTDVEGVPDQTEVYSTTHGYQFYVDSGGAAPLDDYSGAEDVTKYIVPQTLDGKIPEATFELVDGIATVPRVALLSSIALEAQSGNADDCIGIDPQGYAEGDLVLISGLDEDNAITFVQDATGNLVLKDGESYLSTGVGRWMLLKHNGGTFTELIRASSSQGLIGMTYGQGLAAISAGTLVPGTQYLITDRGHRGLVLTAVATNRFGLEGQFIAAVPDYQNTTGNFIGDWNAGLTPSVNQIVAYGAGLQYVNTTGTNTSTNPASDTTNWTLRSRTASTDYIVEVHSVEYDYANDYIVKRSDDRGNSVTLGTAARESVFDGLFLIDDKNLDYFWWGNDNVTGCQLSNFIIERTRFYLTGTMNSTFMDGGVLTSDGVAAAEIEKLDNSRLVLGGFVTTSSYAQTELRDVIVAQSLFMSGNGITSTLIDFNGGSVTNLTINSQNANSIITVDGDISMTLLDLFRVFSTGTANFTLRESMNFSRLVGGVSDGEIEKVITGLTEIDFGLAVEGVINLTSTNATETISSVDNLGLFVTRFRLQPESGLAVTLEGADPASPADTEILIPPVYWDDVSPGAFGSLTLDGDNGDYCEIRVVIVDGSTTYVIVDKVVQF